MEWPMMLYSSDVLLPPVILTTHCEKRMIPEMVDKDEVEEVEVWSSPRVWTWR